MKVDDYRRKEKKKRQSLDDPAFALWQLSIVLFLKALFEIWESDRNSHSRFFLT
jgi:hypothetical protein